MFFLQIYKPDSKKSWRFKDKLIRFDGQMTKVEVTMTSNHHFSHNTKMNTLIMTTFYKNRIK